MATLAADQIYSIAVQAGFPPATAVKMTAIALKESAGDPVAHNSTPPDDSYGLWQINMYGALGPQRMAAWGLNDPADLFDPAVNARAALALWNGNDANLAKNWFIDRGIDMARYQQFLPIAQAAAGLVAGAGATQETGGGGAVSTGATSFSPGRSGAPTPRPGSTVAPLPPGGGTSLPLPSSSPASAGPSSSQSYSTSDGSWLWTMVHLAGVIGWPVLAYAFPFLTVPALAMAPLVHGALPRWHHFHLRKKP